MQATSVDKRQLQILALPISIRILVDRLEFVGTPGQVSKAYH